MTAGLWGALLGGLTALGVLMVVSRLSAIGRVPLASRVLPYIRDLPATGAASAPVAGGADSPARALTAMVRPWLSRLAQLTGRILGGGASVRRRLQRAGRESVTVADFRVEQVTWGLVGFGIAAAVVVLRTLADPRQAPAGLIAALLAFVVGAVACDTRLSGQVRRRETRIMSEFPALAELLALAVAAGEGPVAALDRVCARSSGELTGDLRRVLAEIRTGMPVGQAFDEWAARSGLPLISRFAQGIAVAVERGTPLADVLHAQAADVRDAGRRELVELAARKEVAMMIPVVFILLPTTVFFAFWPGVLGLNLTTP